MKIAEFISQESKASTSQSEALTTKTPLPPKTGSQGGASSQVRKPKPGTNSLLTTLMKTTYSSRPEDRQVTLRRRPEGKVIPLKAVEIVLPPVMFPLSSSQVPRAQMPANRIYYRLVGSKVGTHSYVTPSATRRVEKAKESTPSSCVRHPRPWLWLCGPSYRLAGISFHSDTITGASGHLVSSPATLPPWMKTEAVMEGASEGAVSPAQC